ncbi:dUTP diphosphatase [Anoxybacteroides tepidamans]|uniref:dUTP diphosphatase n=1 Tax=Anoxybacteroides tepidamans TaxID=265948 RepID=UPI0004809AA8|nr:dUTP diphosphatase [Anoxybacillus tepidamans]
MNIPLLYSLQRQLDERIETQHGLQQENLVDKKVLALLVELGELANETRCFKFWSVKPPASQEKILEEYVDGLHFILSLGLDCGFTFGGNRSQKLCSSPIEQFLCVYQAVNQFYEAKSFENYEHLFAEYLYLGEQLGFSTEQIERAYTQKNEVNHERQNQNY